MNKTALKNFATWSRRKLIEQVQTKAFLYGIDEKNGLNIEEQFGQLVINEQTYPLSMKTAFTALQKQLEQKGYKQLLEEAAYTWFNRIIAIRYMEVHEYLPERVNVLSSSVGRVDPDILFEYDTMDLNSKFEEIRELVNAGNTEAAYRILFVAQCNALNRILPFMFEPIQDYTELLLPDFLLDAESVIKTLVQNEELTESFAEIEVIGWLYQYYISEEKDRVFAQKSKYKKEEIPFATQLFTPKWIVQYMIQNSLGRYWTEAHREAGDLIDNWGFFIKHEEDFHEKIAPYANRELKVEDIKLLDPAMGSGHILVYAFEVFHEIYEKCGYPERDIPRLILENNLYGLDIDDRAYQLAAFAVVMKAASYSKRFLRSVAKEGIQLNLTSIQETNHISDDVIAYIAQQEVGERYNQVKAFFDQYYNAKTYGSLINLTEREISFIEERLEQIENNPVEDLFYGEQHEIAKQVLPVLIKQTKMMRNEYDVVVMNPPYMGSSGMSKELGDFLKKQYPNSKSDLFSAFMEINQYIKVNGFYAAINQHSWMFLSAFTELRNKILLEKTISSLLHLGPRTFDDLSGEVVQSVAFVLKNKIPSKLEIGEYLKATHIKNSLSKRDFILEKIKKFEVIKFKQSNFRILPDSIIAFWISKGILDSFSRNPELSSKISLKKGMSTGDNSRFIKFWFEVNLSKIKFSAKSREEANESKMKWFPINSGGTSRKWFGNNIYVVNWENDGVEMKSNATILNKGGHWSRYIVNTDFFFKPGITWSAISSKDFSVRYFEEGYLFSSASMSGFQITEDFTILALLNSNVSRIYLEFLAPTLNFGPKQIGKIPYIENGKMKKQINELALSNIKISKFDWDLNEFSWDYIKNSLLNYSAKSLKDAFKCYESELEKSRLVLMNTEKTLNEIFVKIYNLEDVVDPTVSEDSIVLRNPNYKDSVIEFLSYFIGCLLGRYSLDVEGLAYAGGEWNDDKYITFKPEVNGIINITEFVYFENDIIYRLREFLSVAFSPETVDDNLQWLSEALGMKNGEDSEMRIRRYFLDEFFADHCKMYQKRPIYWLVDSGKQKGLRTLIYMHRYQPDIMATIRFELLQEIQAKYQQEIVYLENRFVNPNLSATDKKKLNAEKVSFEKKIEELREFDKRLASIAAEEIEIDLDDGVKVNYEKFYRGGKGVLAKIK